MSPPLSWERGSEPAVWMGRVLSAQQLRSGAQTVGKCLGGNVTASSSPAVGLSVRMVTPVPVVTPAPVQPPPYCGPRVRCYEDSGPGALRTRGALGHVLILAPRNWLDRVAVPKAVIPTPPVGDSGRARALRGAGQAASPSVHPHARPAAARACRGRDCRPGQLALPWEVTVDDPGRGGAVSRRSFGSAAEAACGNTRPLRPHAARPHRPAPRGQGHAGGHTREGPALSDCVCPTGSVIWLPATHGWNPA